MQLAGVVVHVDGMNGKHPRDAWSALDGVPPIGKGAVGRSFGVCWPSFDKGYDYMAAVELPAGAALPKGFVRRHVEAQRYVVLPAALRCGDFCR